MSWGRVRRVAAALVVAVALIACSSDDGSGSGGASATSAPTTRAKQKPSTTRSTVPAPPSRSQQARELCAKASGALAEQAPRGTAETTFQGHRVVFASRAFTEAALTADDSFLRQLSALDRQILTLSTTSVDKGRVVERLRTVAMDWTADEVRVLRDAIAQAEQAANAAGITLQLPETVYFAKGSADVFSGFPYTRCATVFMGTPIPAAVVLHELYHVMTRHHPDVRPALYALVGYRPCRVSLDALGPDLRNVVITNPDTEAFGEYCINLDKAGQPTTYAPLLIGSGPYNGTPDGWIEILLPVLVEVRNNKPVVADGKTAYREMVRPDYMDAVGGNGSYEPFHPEELVAVNLQHALMPAPQAAPDFPNADLLNAVRGALADLKAAA